MEIDAILADSVVVAEGKIYVQGGGWNVINVPQVPAVHDRVGLAILIRVPYTATNQSHQMVVGLVAEDGDEIQLGEGSDDGEGSAGPISKLGAQFNVGRPPTIEAGDEQLVPIGINLNGLKFPSTGQYSFVISIDASEVKRLTFRVNSQPQPMRFVVPGSEEP